FPSFSMSFAASVLPFHSFPAGTVLRSAITVWVLAENERQLRIKTTAPKLRILPFILLACICSAFMRSQRLRPDGNLLIEFPVPVLHVEQAAKSQNRFAKSFHRDSSFQTKRHDRIDLRRASCGQPTRHNGYQHQ